MERLRIFTLPLLLAAVMLLPITSCEKIKDATDKVGEALNRTPEKPGPANQPDPTQILAEEPDAVMPPPPDPEEVRKAAIVINKEARVSILGYHDFTTDERPRSDMIINIDDFRDQLQQIKDAELPVISMREFLDWKQGEADIPAECVMITVDDGWKASHTLATDIMAKFGFPFTVFLYKNYVGVGGRSLTHDEIRDMIAKGGTIGSHSVSHSNMAKKGGKSADDYKEWLRVELEDSYQFLMDNFGETGGVVKIFAYPYGIYSDQIKEMATEYGYEAAFTVNGKKTTWDVDKLEVGRYIVHGTTLANFSPAMSFGGGSVSGAGRKLISESKNEDGEVEGPLVTMTPAKDAKVATRLPLIQMDLSKLNGVVADSISMRITGLGMAPHEYDPETGIVSYQLPMRLRTDSCGVMVQFKHSGSNDVEKIGWNFKVDQLAEYLSKENSLIVSPMKMTPPTENAKGQPVAQPTTAAN
ncbi:polysaccharide deacetylase family protein [Verrucomicrobiales bacterium]|nr:polysaccharide deacetylase family protein [Verrucomicrobiales bacterium]MDB4617587.1 polysaccharide deacetylase family protein [Verrucomicrobiales bacterium]MDB4657465.1 polysaccharide deacetylase family protein [Verrucomicrobiales bacterium]